MDYTFEELELISEAISVALGELGTGMDKKEKALEALWDKVEQDKVHTAERRLGIKS